MEENSFNLSDLFRNLFGTSPLRNWEGFGPNQYEDLVFPRHPKESDLPTSPNPIDIERFLTGRNTPIFYPNLPYESKEINKMKKQQSEVNESHCQCGEKLQPIVVEVSFTLKNPNLTYVGDIFLEYCPSCQDEQFLALACKEASHKFLTNLTQKKK